MRKRIAGDTDRGAALLGVARTMLGQLRQEMAMTNLMIGKRSVQFDDGVTITVLSTFGQEEVQIYAPEDIAQETQEEALERMNADPEYLARKATNNDLVTLNDLLTLTVTVYDNIDIIPTVPGSGTSDIMYVLSSVRLTIITTTPAPPYTPPTPPATIFIGGQDSSGNPFIWDDKNGLRTLGLRNSVSNKERRGFVYGFKNDGTLPFGSVEVYDPTIDPLFTNPISGAPSTTPFGYIQQACVWRNGTGDADVVRWASGETSEAHSMDANGTVHGTFAKRPLNSGVTTRSGFSWNGTAGSGIGAGGAVVGVPSLTSSNGRVRVQGDKYQLDGGPWITFSSGRQSYGVLHIPYTPPTPPDQTPKVTTSVLVFSG